MTKKNTTGKKERKRNSETRKAKTWYWNLMYIGGPLALLIGLVIFWAGPTRNVGAEEITVYKSPSCGCCSKWVNHLRDAGFIVKTINRNDMNSIKSTYNITPKLQSCHTAVIGDYAVEGHVPADDIKRLLRERLQVTGLAAPGMPMGSPGMEGQGNAPYDVLTFDKNGVTQLFASH